MSGPRGIFKDGQRASGYARGDRRPSPERSGRPDGAEAAAGAKRYCSEMMEVCGSRIFGKTGADGVYSLGFLKEKLGCTIKIDDGLMGPQYSVVQRIIEQSGIFDRETLKPLHHYIEAPIVNWAKNATGVSKVNEEIFSRIPAFGKK